MHIKIICIYCLCDDFLSALNLRNDKQYRMTSAEILTVAIVSALFFNGNLARTRLILKHDGYFPNMLTFSQLTSMLPRRIHAVTSKGFLLKFELGFRGQVGSILRATSPLRISIIKESIQRKYVACPSQKLIS